jgi:hypothetical protein
MRSLPVKRGNKYHAKTAACSHGHTHDSRKEARRCDELHLLQRGGVISDLRVQVQFWFTIDGRQVKHENGRRVGIKLDFGYVENGANVVEDTKGVKTEAYVLRAAIFRALFPTIALRET